MVTEHTCIFEGCKEKATFRIKYTDMYKIQESSTGAYAWACDVHMGGVIWNLLDGPTSPAAEVHVSRNLLQT